MRNLGIITVVSALSVLLTGCPQVFDALFNAENPHSLSASTGEGTAIKLSWSSPNLPEDDERLVDLYHVYRDGSQIDTTSSTSYSDSAPSPAVRHSYYVTATFDDSSVSGQSNTEEGWYIPSRPLPLATGPGGGWTQPGSSVTTDGWLRTLVVEGWTYHFELEFAATLLVCSDESPWDQISLGNNTNFTWEANRTGKVWLRTQAAEKARGWYE